MVTCERTYNCRHSVIFRQASGQFLKILTVLIIPLQVDPYTYVTRQLCIAEIIKHPCRGTFQAGLLKRIIQRSHYGNTPVYPGVTVTYHYPVIIPGA